MKGKAESPGGLTREQVIIALRAASEYQGHRISLRLVRRTSDLLGVSQTTLREYLRKDRKAAAMKREIEKDWRAKIGAKAKAQVEELKRTDSQFRAWLEAPEKPSKIDFATLNEHTSEWAERLKNLKI